MNQPKRQKIIAANWKMYKSISQAVQFIQELPPLVTSNEAAIYIAVPFTALSAASHASEKTSIMVGAQNMNEHIEGAFTGEISGSMLIDAGARFVIIGHSERRHLFHESDEVINLKLKRALEVGLQPLLCVGETLAQREAEQTEQVLLAQLQDCLLGISDDQAKNIIIAYEPVWAIGTGKTASPETAQNTHLFIRKILVNLYPASGKQLSILYGGSVKPETAQSLLAQPAIDGLLVGGASLDVQAFSQIVNAQSTLSLC